MGIIRSDKGSVSIEAAIALPIFGFFVLALVSLIQYQALYLITANACITAAEKLSCDACIFYNSGLDSLKKDVRDKAVDLLPGDLASEQISTVLAGVAFDKIESAACESVMFTVFENEFENELRKSGFPMKADVVSLVGSSFFENGTEFSLKVRTKSDYLLPNIFTGKKGIAVDYEVKGDAWLYGGCPRYSVNDINVWELSNFRRGRVLEEIYGANLPSMFPVIDKFDSRTGECVMLLSIDATAPSYSDYENLRKTVFGNAKKLKDFNGGRLDDTVVEPWDIKSKKIILILPDNVAKSKAKELMDLTLGCVAKYGIKVEISFYQHSYVYEKD